MKKTQEMIADKAGISRKIASTIETGSRGIVDTAFIFMFKAVFPTPRTLKRFIEERIRLDSWAHLEEDFFQVLYEALKDFDSQKEK